MLQHCWCFRNPNKRKTRTCRTQPQGTWLWPVLPAEKNYSSTEHPRICGWGPGSTGEREICLRQEYIPKDPDMSSESGINPTILLWGWDWDHQTYEFWGRVWILREKNTLRVQPPFFSPVGCNEFRHVLLRKGGLHYPRGSTILPKWWPCRLPG